LLQDCGSRVAEGAEGDLRKLILLMVVVAVVFLVWNRQRLYVRDPLGSVARDGVKEKGAQVFINYSNDVLLENYNAPMYVTLVQHEEPVGTPATLHCVAYVACLLDADVATVMEGSAGVKAISMSPRMVRFRDGAGRDTVVTLR
jgi:hypothetical protein